MKRKGSTLRGKAIFMFVVFALVLSFTATAVSYKAYTDAFNAHYESLANSVAQSTATVIDGEKMTVIRDMILQTYREVCAEGGVPNYDDFEDADWNAYYARFDYVTQTEEYQSLMDLLQKLRQDHGVVSLYLGYNDLETFHDLYLVDASAEGEGCIPGDCDAMEESQLEKLERGEYAMPAYITNYEEYGWLCSASAPVYNAAGEVVGVALVDISMNDIMAQRENFLYTLGVLIAAISAVVVMLVFFLMNNNILKPIKQLSYATSRFISSKKSGGEDSEISRLNIKTGDELEMLAGSVKKMEQDLNTYISELTAVTAEKERIGAELDVAQHIQSSMLPCIFPAFPERKEFDIYATMTPAKEVGGDFYDFFMVDDNHLAVVMADVSGKGVPAALFMVIAKTLVKDHTQPGRDLGSVFTEVNDLLCESNSEGLFVTAFEGVLDLRTGELRFVNAGHETPFIAKKGEGFQPYKVKAGFVLAGMEGMRYTAGAMQLEEGDKFFQYTDGVTEATDKDNRLYGMERLNLALNNCASRSPEGILKCVKEDIDRFVGEADQFDDITMLCVEYLKKMQ